MTREAARSQQSPFSFEKTSVVDGRGQDSPLLAADPMKAGHGTATEKESEPPRQAMTPALKSHLRTSPNSSHVLCWKHDGLTHLGSGHLTCTGRLSTEPLAFRPRTQPLPGSVCLH